MRGDWSEHGQYGKYAAGCRCEECRAANAVRNRRVRRQLEDKGAVHPERIPHGTTGGYKNWGCRCEECAAANLQKARQWYAKARAAS